MDNQIVIHATEKQKRIALIENGELAQFFIESPENRRSVGDIYLAQVHKVMGGIRAAFIDVSTPKDAFLHYSDLGEHLEEYLMMLNGRDAISAESSKELHDFRKQVKENTVQFEEGYIKTKSNDRAAPKCKHEYTLVYDEETEYLIGNFKSVDCRNVAGKIVLYEEERKFNMDKMPDASHYWKQKFAQNYDKGFPAPAVMKREQENFKFQPIYFDHDKSEIKEEFHDYLSAMARILEGIHDLRVKVIGHTDAVGTDEYNIGLSERRARAIKNYFLSKGIEEDKLEIDFRGEREPIDTNKTPEGKQRNRRVDFKFI